MNKVENYLLGMDCGTTNIKAVIIGEDGTVAAEADALTFCTIQASVCERPLLPFTGSAPRGVFIDKAMVIC